MKFVKVNEVNNDIVFVTEAGKKLLLSETDVKVFKKALESSIGDAEVSAEERQAIKVHVANHMKL